MMKKNFYWDKASERIGELLIKYFRQTMSICEVGCAGGILCVFWTRKGIRI